MNKQLTSLLTCILDEEFGPDPDDSASRNRLIKVLTQALTPDDFSEVVTIAEAIFPKAEVDETMMTCEVIIKTGLYNVAAGGEPAHLVESPKASSREIFSEPDTLFCIYGDQDD